jgi:hypothetical protein
MLNEILEALLILDAFRRRRFERAGTDNAEARETKAALATLRRGVLGGLVRGGETGPIDADALLKTYIAAGGNWQAMCAAVNRNALAGSRPREAS